MTFNKKIFGGHLILKSYRVGEPSITSPSWERQTITYIESKEHKSNNSVGNNQLNSRQNDLRTENQLLREEISKLGNKIENLQTENEKLKKQLEDANKQKSVNKMDNTRSNSVPKFSLSSKIKNNLGTNIGQNNKPLIMKQENVK